jgi:anti-sigma B factor antagonist
MHKPVDLEAGMIDLKTKLELFADGTYVISVAGELDLYSSQLLESELSGLQEKNVRSVVVDLTECEFIDSTALGLLVKAHKQLAAAGTRFSLVATDRNIRRIFEITGLDRVLTIAQSRPAAMNGGLRVTGQPNSAASDFASGPA